MTKTRRLIKRALAAVLCAIMLTGLFDLSVFAATNSPTSPISNEEIMEALQNAQVVNPDDDSGVREIVEISDDYPVALEEITPEFPENILTYRERQKEGFE